MMRRFFVLIATLLALAGPAGAEYIGGYSSATLPGMSPNGGGPVKEVLLAARTYFVRTDGLDTNTGLVDSAAGAFLTWQKCASVAITLDTNQNDVNCKHGTESGVKTFTLGSSITVSTMTGGGSLRFEGSSTPGNTVISATGFDNFLLNNTISKVYFKNITLTGGQSGQINVVNLSTALVESGVRFGAGSPFAQVYVHDRQAQFLALNGGFEVFGNALYWFFSNGGMGFLENEAVTFTGPPAFVGGFVGLTNGGSFQFSKLTGSWTGTFTGPRFSVDNQSVLNLGNSGPTEFPGTVVGTLSGDGRVILNGNFNLPIDAQGTGTIEIGGISTGIINLRRDTAVAGTATVTSTSASALTIGRQGATDPAFKVDASAGTSATGIQVTAAAAAGGVNVAAISSGSNENLTINAKGTGTVSINPTGTGAITLSRDTNVAGTLKPTVTSSTSHALDATSSATFSVTNGANQALPTVNAGLMIVTDTSTGAWALYGGDGATGTKMITEDGTAQWVNPTTTPGAGKSSIAYNGSTYAVYNNVGSSQNFRVVTLRTR